MKRRRSKRPVEPVRPLLGPAPRWRVWVLSGALLWLVWIAWNGVSPVPWPLHGVNDVAGPRAMYYVASRWLGALDQQMTQDWYTPLQLLVVFAAFRLCPHRVRWWWYAAITGVAIAVPVVMWYVILAWYRSAPHLIEVAEIGSALALGLVMGGAMRSPLPLLLMLMLLGAYELFVAWSKAAWNIVPNLYSSYAYVYGQFGSLNIRVTTHSYCWRPG